MAKTAEEKFRNSPFYAFITEREKKTAQFNELISLEYEWLSTVLDGLPAMLPKEEFVVLPTKTPKKKAVKRSIQALPAIDLDDCGSNLGSTSGGMSMASTSSRVSRKPKVSKAKGKQKAADIVPLTDDEASRQGPMTLEDLRCESPVPAAAGRRLRSTRASKKAVASAASPKQRVSTRSMRQAGGRKLSTHSRNCPFSPHRAPDPLHPAASTPDNPAEQRKQRTLRLKRNAAASKRLFLTPEKKKELFGVRIVSPVEKKAEANKTAAKVPSSKAEVVQSEEGIEKSCADIAEHFITANESPIEKQLNSTPISPSVPPPSLPFDQVVKDCIVKLTPLKKDAIQKWLESADPVDDCSQECSEEENLVTDDEDKENSAIFVEARKSEKSTPRVSRKRSSRQAQLSEPSANSKILKETEMNADEDVDINKSPQSVQGKEEENADSPEVVEEEAEDEDEIAPLPEASAVTQLAPKNNNISADDSLVTDDEDWSTINDDEMNTNSMLNHSSASAGQMSTPSGNHHRPRMAHSADGGAKRFNRVKRWISADSRKSNSSEPGGSRLSNMSTPGRLQKRLSSSRQQEAEEERRRELKERMQKDLQRLKEREWRLAQEREARKKANEARRQQVLSKRDAVFKEKLSTMQQMWEKKEQHLAEQERERREEELRRKQALAQLRKQNEQREREERERREADARKQREEAMRRMKEDLDRRAREAERKAKEEAERRLKEEVAKKMREEAERKAKEEAARKAREEERRAKEEAARKEAERKAKEEARRQAELARRAREEERRKREEDERKRAVLRERTLQLEMARKELELTALRNATALKNGEQLAKPVRRYDENYDISDLHSDQETDDDEDPRKRVPAWATKNAMKRKCRHFFRLDVKWWKIFRPAETLHVDLNSIFSESRRSFRPRTSSAIWHTPPALKATTPRH